MKIVACNSNRPLAEAISAYLNLSLCKATIRRFSDMECFVEIDENENLSQSDIQESINWIKQEFYS